MKIALISTCCTKIALGFYSKQQYEFGKQRNMGAKQAGNFEKIRISMDF